MMCFGIERWWFIIAALCLVPILVCITWRLAFSFLCVWQDASDHVVESLNGEVGSSETLVSELESLESLLSEGVEAPVLRSYDVEDTDEFYCEYDSTWDDPPSKETSCERSPKHYTGLSTRQRSNRFNNFRNAARDMQKYRCDYPDLRGQQQDDRYMPNLQFYLGQRASSPDGIYIEDFHNNWYGNYSKLERVHSYIQWLFPLQERGMNYQAKELTKKEIEAFLGEETAKKRLVKSYKLMLDFYGIQLSNDTTGEVRRANNWRDRFDNMDRNTHNNLRITRILKCLGTLGFPHYQAPLVRFFLEETLVEGKLYHVKESVLNYFIFAVRDKQQRRELVKYAYKNYEPKHEFVWCPKKIQNIFSNREAVSNNIQLKAGQSHHGDYSDDYSVPREDIVNTVTSHGTPGEGISEMTCVNAPKQYGATGFTKHSNTAHGNEKNRLPTKDVQNIQGDKTTGIRHHIDSEGKKSTHSVNEPTIEKVSQSRLNTKDSANEPHHEEVSSSQVMTNKGPATGPPPKEESPSQVLTNEGPATGPPPKEESLSQVMTNEVLATGPPPKEESPSQVLTNVGPATGPSPKEQSPSQVMTNERPATWPPPKEESPSQVMTNKGPATEPHPKELSPRRIKSKSRPKPIPIAGNCPSKKRK